MRFIVDAQLPRRLAHELAASGHDVKHTLDLPQQNRTPDGDITALAATEDRVVVTKDSDFVTTFLLHGAPPKLLLISTGNISNDALSRLIAANADEAAVTRQVDKVEALRSHLNKMRTLQLLHIRQVLTPDQRTKLNKIHDQWEKDHARPPRGNQ